MRGAAQRIRLLAEHSKETLPSGFYIELTSEYLPSLMTEPALAFGSLPVATGT